MGRTICAPRRHIEFHERSTQTKFVGAARSAATALPATTASPFFDKSRWVTNPPSTRARRLVARAGCAIVHTGTPALSASHSDCIACSPSRHDRSERRVSATDASGTRLHEEARPSALAEAEAVGPRRGRGRRPLPRPRPADGGCGVRPETPGVSYCVGARQVRRAGPRPSHVRTHARTASLARQHLPRSSRSALPSERASSSSAPS